MIVASRDFRKLVHPRRGHPLATPRRIDGARAFAGAKAAWAATSEHWQAGWARRTGDLELERAAGAILSGEAPLESADRNVLAAAERMLNGTATLVGCVAERFGAAEALRMKWRSHAWMVTTGRAEKIWWWMLGEAKPGTVLFVDTGWNELRAAACRAGDADYADARASAAAFREAESAPGARVRLDWVFPGEPDWANADLRAMLAGPAPSRTVALALPLLASIADETLVGDLLRILTPVQAPGATTYACDLVVGLGEDGATRALAQLAEIVLRARVRDQTQLHALAAAMTAIRTDAMGVMLARWLRHPRFGRWVASHFESDAPIASAALGPMARGKSLLADTARAILAANARAAEPDEGSMDDAPALLRETPWRRDSRPPLELETLAWNETIAWQPGERERIAATPAYASPGAEIRPISASELAAFDALPPGHKNVDVWPRWENKRWLMLELPDARVLELWDAGTARLYSRPPCWVLARFGERALPGLFARDPFTQWDDERWLVARLRVDSPKSALTAARVFSRRRSQRKRAREWLLAHAEASAIGLIPAALARESRGRRIAVRALRMLAAAHPEVVERVAARYGDQAREAVRSFLFCDPLARIDARGLPPKWLRIDSLPRLRNASGRPLPREAAKRLVDVLRGRGQDVPYAGIDVLRRELDPESFSAFGWALFSIWILHGAPRTHVWMARALDACARDDTATRLRPYARELARTDSRACGVLVDLLVAIGDSSSRVLLTELEGLARASLLRQILAEARGDESELVELEIDARGEASFDLGGRTVRVVVEESLAPRVVLDDGRRLAQMPRASKTDDPARVAAATACFNRLRRACAATAGQEIARLERAMLASRRFRARDVLASWARHAIALRLARRVVWGVFSASELVTTFRVADDGSLANDGDLPLDLDPDATIGVVHPIDLDESLRAAWGAIFGDYELVQPFEQLGRATFDGSPAEALAITKALVGVTIGARSLLETLDTHGWQRSGRRIVSASRALRGAKSNLVASITFSPGVDVIAKHSPEQKITGLAVPAAPALVEIERIELSELVRTATTLGA